MANRSAYAVAARKALRARFPQATEDQLKRATYAWLYGAPISKIAAILSPSERSKNVPLQSLGAPR